MIINLLAIMRHVLVIMYGLTIKIYGLAVKICKAASNGVLNYLMDTKKAIFFQLDVYYCYI